MLESLRHPWPWYIAGPLIGLTVPVLLIIGNRSFGISATLRHVCAACMPANISFFKYNWKKEVWNLFFAVGIVLGGVITALFLANPAPTVMHPTLVAELAAYGVTDHYGPLPVQLYNWQALLAGKGLILMVGGGFLVGFGTRYAGGCTSGHAVMGLSTLQWPSLVATCCFFAGGLLMANWILPFILLI